jgi:hypothetical protein
MAPPGKGAARVERKWLVWVLVGVGVALLLAAAWFARQSGAA